MPPVHKNAKPNPLNSHPIKKLILNPAMLLCTGTERWRVGAVVPLNKEDETPLLGKIEEGNSLLAAESGLYRAPAVAHDAAPRDFLLIRK